MKLTTILLLLPLLTPPEKELICTGKVHEIQTNFLSSDRHDYYLFFNDGTTVKTRAQYFSCYEKGDTATFFYRDFRNSEGKHIKYEWQMINKCP